jgi:phosphohistidine phosphatase
MAEETVEIFLVRHGRALAEEEDPRRPLSPEGADEVERIAAWAHDRNVRIRQIIHSGKLRAEQTAGILSRHLNPDLGIKGVSGLNPHDDVYPAARMADKELSNSMLVGHLPFLGRLAGLLAAGDPKREVVEFPTAGMACLRKEKGVWSVSWTMGPESLARPA